jgi:hypothetical protein
MARHDYAFPFRIDAGSLQAARADYPSHVEQMVRQVLMTAPGERVDLPEFGCGLRQLIFAPHSSALDSATKILIKQSLDRWLGTQIRVGAISVNPGADGDESTLEVDINYTLIDSGQSGRTRVQVV